MCSDEVEKGVNRIRRRGTSEILGTANQTINRAAALGMILLIANTGFACSRGMFQAGKHRYFVADRHFSPGNDRTSEATSNAIIVAGLRYLFLREGNKYHKPWLCYISENAGGLNYKLKQSIGHMGIATVGKQWISTLQPKHHRITFLYNEVGDLQLLTKTRAVLYTSGWEDFDAVCAEGTRPCT